MANKKKAPALAARLRHVLALLCLTTFPLLYWKDQTLSTLFPALLIPVVLWVCTALLPRFWPIDRLLVTLVGFLCSVGLLTVSVTSPSDCIPGLLSSAVGLGCMLGFAWLPRMQSGKVGLSLFAGAAAVVLLLLPIAAGPVQLAGLSLDVPALAMPLLLIFVTDCLSRRKYLSALIIAAVCLALLFVQKDYVSTAICFLTILLTFLVADGSLLGIMVGGLLTLGACWLGSRMLPSITATASAADTQLIRHAFTSGGLFGIGFANDATLTTLTADTQLAVICEQFGWIVCGCMLLCLVLLLWHCRSIAGASYRSRGSLLACSCTVMLTLQIAAALAGALGLLPLSGIPLPFVSMELSPLIGCMSLIGLIQGVASLHTDDLDEAARLVEETNH